MRTPFNLPRRRFLHFAAAVSLVGVSGEARADGYPSRPIRFVVGFPPGGGADIVSRIMAAWLSERLGQSVVVENKPGASTNISLEAVVNSPPDGYTLVFIAASAAVNVSVFNNLTFNLTRDIAPVAGLIDFPLVLVAHPSVPAKSIPELITYAKTNPGKLGLASFGTGTTSHVAGELFKHDGRGRHGARAVQGRRSHADRPHGGPGAARIRCDDRRAAAHPVPAPSARSRSPAASAFRACPKCRPSAKPCHSMSPIPGAASARRVARPPTSSRGSTARSTRASPIRR